MAHQLHRIQLQDSDFRGKNLTGKDFSNTDIRGVNFSNAILIGANFSNTKAGLSTFWIISLFILTIILSLLAGLISGYSGAFISDLLNNNSKSFFLFGNISLLILGIFLIIIFWRGLGVILATLVDILAAYLITALAFFPSNEVGDNLAIGAQFTALALAGVMASVGNIAVAVALAKIIAMPAALSYIGLIGLIGIIFGVLLGVRSHESVYLAYLQAGLIGLLGITCGMYVGYQAINGDQKYKLIRLLTVGIVAYGGTSFRRANLTDANFTQATLSSVDFREANLTRTCWFQAKNLEQARIEGTYLEKPNIRQLVITKEGRGQEFKNLNLRYLNLKGANLQDANFFSTDLSEANLEDANFSRAKLAQTQLYQAKLTKACLTGAFIENWGISTHTQLEGIVCDYVYMRLPTQNDPKPCRKPDDTDEVFAPGAFKDFIKPLVDTLDLYHHEGVDPRAIAISFKQLAENHPDAELRIVGMEVKGRDKFLLKAKASPNTDKSELSAEYFSIYNELKALAQQELKALITEKDIQIRRLENMVMTALERPNFYAQTYNNQGDTMSTGHRKQSNFNLQDSQFAGGLVDAETVTAHEIGGNINNYTQANIIETKNSTVKTILILVSNPKTTSSLRLDEEVREIDAGLQRAKKRELFDLKQRLAVRVQDIYQALLDFKPQYVHFSGHGSGDDGLVLEDETGNVRLVDTVALAFLFKLFASNIECVVLNACYSEVQASAIAQHIPYVIGMNKAIGDKAAIKFATGFYSALGAGESVEFAYKLGCSVIQLDGILEHLTPTLKKKQ